MSAGPLATAVDAILRDRHGITLDSYLHLARTKPKPDSYEVISRAVARDTGVTVSWATVRRWYDLRQAS